MKFDHKAVFNTEALPLVTQIVEICKDAGISCAMIFDVVVDDESEKPFGEIHRALVDANESYLSFPLAIMKLMAKNRDFAMRLEKAMPILMMTDQEIMLESISPHLRKILTPRGV